MERITLEQVKDWYSQANISPMRGTFLAFLTRGVPIKGCALGALYCANHKAEEITSCGPEAIRQYASNLYSENYIAGFVLGFDNPVAAWTSPPNKDVFLGYTDGREIGTALFD